MSKITGIGIALLLVICVPKILSFYDISLSAYGPYLAFLVFIVILAFILPHNFLVTVDTVANAAKNISEGSDASAATNTDTSNATANAEGQGVEEPMNPSNIIVREEGGGFEGEEEFEGIRQGRQGRQGGFEVTGGGNSSQQYNNNNNNNNYSGSGMSPVDMSNLYDSISSNRNRHSSRF